MYLASEIPPARWFNNGSQLLRLAGSTTGYGNAPPAVPQVRWAESSLANTTDWVRISGSFQATGQEMCVVIGSFTEGPTGASNKKAYYYLDDVSISEFPRPQIAERLVKCGEQVWLGTEDCLLPLTSGAEYQWTSDGGFVSGWLSTPEATVFPTQTAGYTLTVRVPIAGQPGNFQQSSMHAGEVEVITPSCQLACLGEAGTAVQSVYTLLGGSYKLDTRTLAPVTNVFTFPMYGVFHVDSDLLLTGGGTVIVPEGTVLLMDANTKITLENTTLIVAGGTITAACFEGGLWNGIYAKDSGSGVRTLESDENLRHPEISGMAEGIQLNPPQTPSNAYPTSTGWFSFEDTRFRNNLKTLTSRLTPSSTAPAGTIANCSFDADPALLGDHYPLWHISLSGNRLQTAIQNSTFDQAAFGLYADGMLRLGNTGGAIRVEGNTFRNFYLAAVYVAAPAISPNTNELHLDNNTFELYTPASIPATYTNYSTALALLWTTHTNQFRDATTLVPTTFGVFTERATVTLTHNVFRQAVRYPNYDYAAHRSPQIGAYVQHAASDAKIVSNEFFRLHEGLRGLHAPSSFVQNNLFDDCKIGAHVLANSASANPICLDCNTFRRGAWSSPHSVYGVSQGVLIDQGAVVSLERHNVSSTVSSDRVLGNRFVHFGRTIAQFNGTTWPATTPTFSGYDNAIVNNSVTSLEYLTYDDDDVTTTNYHLEHAPAAVHQSWTGNGYNGSTNLTVLTPGANPLILAYQVTSQTDCSTRPEGFTQGLLERYSNPVNEPSGAPLAAADRPVKARAMLTCYPNPAEGATQLAYSLPTGSSQVRIEVRDLTGRLWLTQPVTGQVGTGEVRLSLIGLPTGILSCQLIVDGAVRATQRLIHSLNGRL